MINTRADEQTDSMLALLFSFVGGATINLGVTALAWGYTANEGPAWFWAWALSAGGSAAVAVWLIRTQHERGLAISFALGTLLGTLLVFLTAGAIMVVPAS